MSRKFSHFIDLLNYRASEQSTKTVFTFLSDGETVTESITYQQLDEQARAIASVLQSYQAEGGRALLLYQPGLEFISAFFGCLYGGVIAVPAYPPRANRSLERLESIIADAQANFILTTQALVSTIEGKLTQSLSTEAIRCITTDNLDLNRAKNWQKPQLSGDNLAFLQYTSGSTGIPKGVMVSHENLIYNSELINRCFQDAEDSKGVSWLPPYHDMGLIGGILQPIYVGATMALMPPVSFLQRPLRWLEAISRYQITTSGAPNFAYELCVTQIPPEQRENLNLSSWQLAFTGAEPVRAETLEIFAKTFAPCGFRRQAFYPCYGMAETTLIVSGGEKEALPVLKTFDAKGLEQNQVIVRPSLETGNITLVGCGKSADNQEIIIVNPETLKRCHSQEIGEIWVQGKSVAQGYWNRKVQTEAAFHAYLENSQERTFLRTGDLGFLEDGELFVTGRLKDLIIIRGRNHYPQDIELTVERSHSALRKGCGDAVSIDIQGEEKLVVIYEVKRSYIRKLDIDEVTAAIRKAVAENHELQPSEIVLLKTGSIPKTSSGKIQRHACKAGFLQGSLDIIGNWQQENTQNSKFNNQQLSNRFINDAYANNNQQQKIQGWLINNIAQRLGIKPQEIDISEPFVSYGLDSVQAVRLSAELEDWLGRKLLPTLAYDYPTIEALSEFLAQESSTSQLTINQPLKINHQQEDLIAIIGLGCRFPGANNPEDFWQLLCQGKDAITQVNGRWLGDDWGGFLEKVDEFDAQFFGISTREAKEMDPQQRLLLEVSWQALENAGIPAEKLTGSATGVFVGISSSDYSQIRLQNSLTPTAYASTGNAHSIAANRLSYWFDFRGPSLTIDTACSSSLVAVHLAIKSIQSGECQQALVGGVNLILTPELTEAFTQAGMMAADGKCKTFDADADGYVRGEGCGVIILKSLTKAIENDDNILAVIRSSAINQDGRSNGLTAPNGLSQQTVIQQALVNANINPSEISYIETHGTGTSLGDPIEVNSLKNILLQERSFQQPLWLGSVKTNIGHLEAAAGIAGLIKTVLCLQYKLIPPHLHLNTLNPYIDLKDTPIFIPTQLQPWESGETPRLAGVSSFGFGGTNAHVILEEWRESDKAKVSGQNLEFPLIERPLQIFTLSAKGENAVKDLVKFYQEYLTSNPQVTLENICYTANTGRCHFNHRLAIITNSLEDLQKQLGSYQVGQNKPEFIAGIVEKKNNFSIAFLFTGQGSQYVGMGYELYQTQPTFRANLEHCAAILQPYLEKPLLEILYPHNKSDNSNLDETIYTQPALFALEYSLAQLWQSWGVKPTVVMGHSVGEYVAACIAGVFSLEDGLKLIAKRAKLMQNLTQPGEMVAIFADEITVKQAIQPYQEKVSIAAINGYHSIVISGEIAAIREVVSELKSQGIKTRKLQVSHGFHSALMDSMLEEFEKVASQIEYFCPNIDIVSNLTGKLVREEITTPQYWVNHVRKPVKFAQSIEFLHQQNYQIFLEIGAKPTLSGMGHSILEGRNENQIAKSYLWLPSLRQGYQDWQQLLKSLSILYAQGIEINWAGFDKDYHRQRLTGLPTYPFQRQRYWLIDDFLNSKQPTVIPEAKTSLENLENCFYKTEWQLKTNFQKLTINQRQEWLIFADNHGLGEKIAQQLKESGYSCFLVYPGDSYQENKAATGLFPSWIINPANSEDFQRLFKELLPRLSSSLKGIIHLWSLEEVSPSESTLQGLEAKQILGCGSVLNLIQALYPQSVIPKLWLVTRGSQPIDSHNNNLSIAQSPLWGMGKVIALEHPEYWGGMIDLDSNSEENEASLLVTEILNSDGEDYLAFRQGKRHVSRLKKIKLNPPFPKEKIINAEASYLITGGLGAVGLKVAHWLVKQGAKYLILIGRSEASLIAKQTIEALENEGINVFTAQADVANEQDLGRILDNINTSLPPLKGIIHAAGILDDGILQGISWKRFNKVLKPKIQGAWNLHNLTQNLSLDFFITFSSVASLLGSPGQGNYAAANAFLDALSYYRQSQGFPSLSINWGALSDGMAKNNRFAIKGLEIIKTEAGLDSLEEIISANLPQVGVISIDWENLRKHFPDVIQSPYFQEIIPATSQTKIETKKSSLFEELLAIKPPEREVFLIPYLQSSIAKIMQMDVQQITTTESLLDVGMDSLMVMEAINQLKSDLQLMLYPREFYERPKIEALAKYLAIEFEKSYGTYQETEITHPILVVNPQNQVSKSANKLIIEKKLPGIVFILSSPRSGSTLLRVMLAGHPNLSSPPELHLLPFNTMGERSEELALSHLGEGLQRAFMELKEIDGESSQKLVAELVAKNTSIPEVYALLQKLAGNRLVVDKSPTYASNRETLERAEAIFKDAKYIHLVRHPYAVIESFCRLRMDKLVGAGNSNPYQLAEEIWRNSNQNTLDFLKNISPDRHHQIHYEELVKQPNQIMSGLCQFLGITFDSSLLNPYEGERMTDGVYNKSMSVGDPNFLKRREIDPQLADTWKTIKLPYPLSENSRQIATSLNYELPNESSFTSSLEMEENYQEIRGLKLCLCTWGPTDGELIVCLHGILEQGAAWSEVARRLAERGYRVVAPDLRGHGKSDHVGQGRSYNVLDFLGDIDAIVAHLTNKPFTLVGHSLGSVIAAMFASIRPQKVKNLVLVETILPTEVTEDEAVEQLATHLDYLISPPAHPIFSDVAKAARRLKMATPAMSEGLAMKLAARITESCQGGMRWRWDAVLRTRAGIGFNGINKSRYLGLLKRIQSPITLIYGDKSDFNRPEDLLQQQKAMPTAKKIVVSGGHNLHLETAAELAEIIVDG